MLSTKKFTHEENKVSRQFFLPSEELKKILNEKFTTSYIKFLANAYRIPAELKKAEEKLLSAIEKPDESLLPLNLIKTIKKYPTESMKEICKQAIDVFNQPYLARQKQEEVVVETLHDLPMFIKEYLHGLCTDMLAANWKGNLSAEEISKLKNDIHQWLFQPENMSSSFKNICKAYPDSLVRQECLQTIQNYKHHSRPEYVRPEYFKNTIADAPAKASIEVASLSTQVCFESFNVDEDDSILNQAINYLEPDESSKLPASTPPTHVAAGNAKPASSPNVLELAKKALASTPSHLFHKRFSEVFEKLNDQNTASKKSKLV